MNELIINDKLTPTMERVRNGKIQMFRESNPDDRSFISMENADVVLEHPTKRSMYAELIDGKWYWVEGCQECKGLERSGVKSYIECDEHNVCRDCKRPRNHFKGAVWGGSKGWQCYECEEEKRQELKSKAFERLNGGELDTMYLDKIICPHCGTEQGNDDVYEHQESECYICKGKFEIQVGFTRDFSTTIIGERVLE